METVWALITEWVADGGAESDVSFQLFRNETDARAEMKKEIADEKANDHLFDKDYVEEESENSYVVYEDGAYCEDHWSITLEPKIINKGDTTMNRIDAIKNYAVKQQEATVRKQIELCEKEEALKQTILGWHDRIQELIDTANACVENGIRFWHDGTSRGYENGHYLTDGWCHILGFEMSRFYPSKITRIGEEGGGACDFNVFTDGNTITATGKDRMWALERFVKDFESFETSFYAYVDKICNK